MKLNGQLVEAFAGTFLSPRYDNPAPTPQFHRESWNLYTSDHDSCCVVAPRDHAKSTSLTFDYILAEVCFRSSDYVILIGSSEDKAAEQLSNISEELHENADLIAAFGIKSFDTDQKTEIIVLCDDGHRFRILARGAEQKIRGAMWKGKRPNLIVCDDMEDDEQVESDARRRKFRKWFFRAAKQSLSKTGKIRVHGTILHEDSLLARLQKNKAWHCLFYKAHEAYDDFSNILWPQRWTEQQLREKRKEFEEDGDSTGYAQEFLNDPHDRSDSYLKEEQFRPMVEIDYEVEKLYYAGCDFAVSKRDHANRTSFTVGGRVVGGTTHITDEYVARVDPLEWIREMFYLQEKWNIQLWFVEGGQIWLSLSSLIYQEMLGETRSPPMVEEFGKRDIYLNIEVLNPVRDKGVRGRSLQKRMRAGTMKFDTKAPWFVPYRHELLRFTGVAEARLDDQFDSTATLCLGLDKLPPLEEEDIREAERELLDNQVDDSEVLSFLKQSPEITQRSSITGY